MSVSDTVFFGGAIFKSISSTLVLYPAKRVWTIEDTVGSITVRLPDATTLKTGGPYFYILNIGPNQFNVRDGTDIILAIFGTNKSLTIALAQNGTTAGIWYTKESTIL